jgi:hypothetical protein
LPEAADGSHALMIRCGRLEAAAFGRFTANRANCFDQLNYANEEMCKTAVGPQNGNIRSVCVIRTKNGFWLTLAQTAFTNLLQSPCTPGTLSNTFAQASIISCASGVGFHRLFDWDFFRF